MYAQKDFINEHKTKLITKLGNYKAMLERKADMLGNILEDIDNETTNLDFCFDLIKHIEKACILESRNITDYLVITDAQLDAINKKYAEADKSEQSKNKNPEKKEQPITEQEKKAFNKKKEDSDKNDGFETEIDEFDDL